MIRMEKVMVIFSLLSPSHHCMGFGGHVIRRKKKKLAPVSLADELGGGWGNKQDKAGTDSSLPPASDELGREKLRFIPSQGDKACGILHMRGGINPCFSYPLLKQRKRQLKLSFESLGYSAGSPEFATLLLFATGLRFFFFLSVVAINCLWVLGYTFCIK